MEENKDGLSEYLRKAEEAMNADVNDPDYEDKQREFAKSYMDAFVPKNHTTMINPKKYKEFSAAIEKIKSIVDDALSDYGDDVFAEYKVDYGGFLKENLDFSVIIPDVGVDIPSLEFFRLVPMLPDDFLITILPRTDCRVEIVFQFNNVKEVISQDRVPADDWFDE